MPLHDWTRVIAGDFHDFHQVWTVNLRTRLNQGILPEGLYAQVEQQAGGMSPDVITLEDNEPQRHPAEDAPYPGAVAVAREPPQVAITAELERRLYAEKKNVVAVRHASDRRIVAMIEIVSSGNKSSEREFRRFVEKSVRAIEQGVHLLIIDPYPPTSRDPEGLHGAIWSELGGDDYRAPRDKPLTMVAYLATSVPKAYIQPIAVGDALIDMPLFISDDQYVSVPLAAAYDDAFVSSPPHVRRILSQP